MLNLVETRNLKILLYINQSLRLVRLPLAPASLARLGDLDVFERVVDGVEVGLAHHDERRLRPEHVGRRRGGRGAGGPGGRRGSLVEQEHGLDGVTNLV